MTTYEWTISQLDCYPTESGNTDVVFNIHWTLTGTEAGFTGSVYGTAGVSLEAGAPYTPYADLTQDQVVAWVEASLGDEGVDAIKDNIDGQIDNQIAPTVVTPALPWVSA